MTLLRGHMVDGNRDDVSVSYYHQLAGMIFLITVILWTTTM